MWRNSGGGGKNELICSFSLRKVVEAAGVEPASENTSSQSTTCVSPFDKSRRLRAESAFAVTLFFHRIYEDVGLGTRSAIPHPRRSQVAPMESKEPLSPFQFTGT